VRAGEGKTFTAANLAVALAGSDRRVLLVDADLRKPDQHRLFETAAADGLTELILRSSQPTLGAANGFHRTKIENLSLLTSGAIPPNPAELLASRRAASVLSAASATHDLVVVDTAPAGVVTDALSFAAIASATILVIEAGRTNATLAADTIGVLQDVGANVIGVVLNKAARRARTSYYYAYGGQRDSDRAKTASPDPIARTGKL
jgi:capsular exopolysaccharide synthesis family protein